MMNWKPRVRSDSAPMTSANTIETRIASGQTMKALVTPDDGQHAGGIGADAEERRLAEGDQPGIAQQQIDD